MKKHLLTVFIFLTALYACGVKSAEKTASTDEHLTPALAKGKALYKDNCSKCHAAFDVKTITVERWQQVLQPMIKDEAKMNEADGKLVEAYVWHQLGVKG